ncbi:DTX [Mytilus coruscus]|uniref:E3 ubiquitin-protein ligase n=1 Tax=Mytilus coruscus TaxID=42192 RepID=A0A6J8BUT5_MYTCO|nr:DTX [Mytilus coruscus]
MAGVRVSQISRDLDVEDLKIYFSNTKHAGGKIDKIYFPLLNNDAVIFFRNQEVVDLLLSRDHNIDGHDVHVVRTEQMIFSEISAKLNPEISSLVAVSNRIKDRLEYVIEVQLEENPEDHCIELIGNIFQIELAWNAINHSLKTQRKIHSKIYQRQESKDGDRERSKLRTDEDNDTRESSFTVSHDSLSHKFRERSIGKTARNVSQEIPFTDLDSDPYTSHVYQKRSTARFVEESANRRPTSSHKKGSVLKEVDNVPSYLSSHYNSSHTDPEVRPKTGTITQPNKTDNDSIIPKLSCFDQLEPDLSGTLKGSDRTQSHHLKSLSSNPDYINVHPSDSITVLGSETYQVTEPKIHITNIGDISDDTDEDEVQKIFKSSKGSSDSERSRQANDTFREFSTTSPQRSFPEENQQGTKFTVGNLKVVVTLQNITAVETDGLVNAANGSLFNGAGVAGAISKAAGYRLETECEDFIRNHGNMGTSQVMHTSAGGRLKVRHILHAVGPIWLEQRQERCTYELIQTYMNCFEYADSKLKISSVSVPCISSGIFGAPLDTSVQCFLDAVLLYYDKNKSNLRQNLREIHMVNNDEDAVVTTIVIIHSLLEGGVPKAVQTAKVKFLELKEKVDTSTPRYYSHTDDWGPQTLPVQGNSLRRTSSLDRNSARSKSDRHEFKTSAYNPSKVNSSAVPKFSSPKTTNSKTSGIGSKSSGKSPVLKPTLTNPSSLRPKTAPSKIKASRSRTDENGQNSDYKLTSDLRMNGDFDGTASLPAHLVYQNHIEECPICYERMKNPKTLDKCGHSFCQKCVERHFANGKPVCPTCGTLYGIVRGDQPLASMSYKIDRLLKIPGYEDCDGAIVIQYDVPAGVQMRNHPSPGKRYKALKRTAYLPNNSEGKQVYKLLKRAFDNKLIFTIGASRTTGKEDVLTWNDIHHKTNVDGGPTKFGYPDSTYMNRVREELAAKGIV